jgi:hypothetical protein
MEARMDGVYGVTDFSKAHIVTEGLKEMIRLAEGNGGVIALPEEFGHLALGMLGENHPLVQRLMNTVLNNEAVRREAFEDQYDEYMDLYKGEEHKMAFEAAGKLVAKAMLSAQEEEIIKRSKVGQLLHRIVEAIKELLRKIGLRRVEQAQMEAEGIAGELAQGLLSGRFADMMSTDNITEDGIYYAKQKVKTDITEWHDVVSKLLKIEEKRLKTLQTKYAYHNAKKPNESISETKKQIDMLKDAIKQHRTEEAIISYFGNATSFLEQTKKTLDDIIAGKYGANRACRRIDVIRDTVDGFNLAIDAVQEAINSGELQSTQNLVSAIEHMQQLCTQLMNSADNKGMQYFQEFLRRFYGDAGLAVTVGKDKGKIISIREMATEAPKDISLFSRWVHSMGNSSDLVLKAIDGVVREAKQKSRAYTNTIKNRVDVAFEAFKKATGSTDQSFMFKYTVDPKTGQVHKTEFYVSATEAKKFLDSGRWSAAQYKFYTEMMNTKKDLDKLLPESMVGDTKIIMLRKISASAFHCLRSLSANDGSGTRSILLITTFALAISSR